MEQRVINTKVTPGMRVQYSDVCNQNTDVLTVLALPGTFTPRNQWATNEYLLINERTLELDWNPCNQHGWRVITD